MKYIQFSLLLLIPFSCTTKGEKVELPKNYRLKPEIQILVDSLSKIKYISIGEKQTIRYNSLVKSASINDLIFLTNNKNPYIRSFSFFALSQKNYPKIHSVFLEHKNDTAFVTTGLYDMISQETVASYMLQTLHFNSKNKYRLSKKEFEMYSDFIDSRDKKLKTNIETKSNWNDTIKKLQHVDLLYTQEYYWSDSDEKDFEAKRRFVKKVIPFKKFDNNIILTAYFEVNGCHPHFPNMERKGDTIILKDQILYKNPCDEDFKVIHKINFVISDQYIREIKTVIVDQASH